MSCPGNIEAVITLAQNAGDKRLTMDEIISTAGGSDVEWGRYLRGPRVEAIQRAANQVLESDNLRIIAMGIGTREYAVTTVAEANARLATQRSARADQHIVNARDAMMDVYGDPRASKRNREFARAWLDLYDNHASQDNLLTFREWADELEQKAARLTVVKSDTKLLPAQAEARPQ